MSPSRPAARFGPGSPTGRSRAKHAARPARAVADPSSPSPSAPADFPKNYPEQWAADVLGSDGRPYHLRPIIPADREAMTRFHATLSERTRYLRYFGPHPTLSEQELDRLTDIDYVTRVGMVCLVGDDIVAHGVYEGSRTASGALAPTAEVAFTVGDGLQGTGLGSILLEHLAGAAADNGLREFTAEVLAENRAMINVFRQAGYNVHRSFDGSEVHVSFDIDPSEALTTVRNARERAAESRSVRNALHPNSVAVIGASQDRTKIGGAVLRHLLAADFAGPVYPVHPERRSIAGVPAFATVADIPGHVDLAIVAVPAASVEVVVEQCQRAGINTLVVLSSGFSDAGEQQVEQQQFVGAAAEHRLVRLARAHGMRVIGPNALGVINTDSETRLNASLSPIMPPSGVTGFFAQSGVLGTAIIAEANRRRLGVSTFVSAGNRADVSGNDLLQYWDIDAATEQIVLYLESFGNPRKFSRIARRVAREKPVIVVKSGHHAATPTLAAHAAPIDEAGVRTLFEESGVIRVDSIPEMFDVACLTAYQPLPAGPRVAIVGNSTALGVLAVDAAEAEGLHPSAPRDLGARVSPEDFGAAIADTLADDNVDAVMAVFAPPVQVREKDYAEALRRAAATNDDKPLITTFLAHAGVAEGLAVTEGDDPTPRRGSVPSYPYPELALRALARVWRYAQWRHREAAALTSAEAVDAAVPRGTALSSQDAQVTSTIRRDEACALVSSAGHGVMDLGDTARLLSCYGISVVDFRIVSTASEAMAAAEELGWPVVVKAAGARWRHRPDFAGVRLGLGEKAAVARAYNDVVETTSDTTIIVQRMAPGGVNMRIAVQDDPSFGSVVSCGLAGTLPTLLGDRTYRSVPVSQSEARAMIDGLKARPLLDGGDASPRADVDCIADLIIKLSRLVDAHPSIREVELDPVLCSEHTAAVSYSLLRLGAIPRKHDVGPRRLR